MKSKKEEEKEEKEKEIFSVFDAFSEMMEEVFVMYPNAEGEKEHITSFQIREMFREALDISVNDITIKMMKKGFRPNIISGTACWVLVRK